MDADLVGHSNCSTRKLGYLVNSIIRENIMLGTCISQVPFYILLELESMQEGDSLHCR